MTRLMTAKQVSDLLQIKISTVYSWTHINFIPHVKLGRAVRFDPEKIERWVRMKERKGRLKQRLYIAL